MFLDKTVILDYYLVVKETIEINTLNDKASRTLLASKINCSFKEINSRKIFQRIYRKNVFIFGASPSLEDDVEKLKEILLPQEEIPKEISDNKKKGILNLYKKNMKIYFNVKGRRNEKMTYFRR